MLIAQITDIHIGFDPDAGDDNNLVRLKRVIGRLIDGPDIPDVLLLTGDLTENGDAQSYAKLAAAMGDCPFPVWPMVGNHDSRSALLAAFPHTPQQDGFVHYAVEGDGLRLLLLDTLEPGRHGGAFCRARAAWLAAQLAAHPQTPTVLVMHHPPFQAGIDWLDCGADDPWIGRFAEAVAGHSQVCAILSGHLHRTIATMWNGMCATVCPSTAPAVALNLHPVNAKAPDGRDMVRDDPAGFGLHRWNGQRLVSHFESVADHRVLARYDQTMQPLVQSIFAERQSDRQD